MILDDQALVVHVSGQGLLVLTGWKAQHRFATALPDAFIPNAVGTSYTIASDQAAA